MTPREFERVISNTAQVAGLQPEECAMACVEMIAISICATVKESNQNAEEVARPILTALVDRVNEIQEIM